MSMDQLRAPWVKGASLLALGLLALLLPGLPLFWFTLLNYIGIASIVGIGLVVLTGHAGMTSFGQAAFAGVGAYATAVATAWWGLSPWLALPVALAASALIAACIGLITLRLSGHYLSLSTLAWGISIYYLFGNSDALGRHDGMSGIAPLSLGRTPLLDAVQFYPVTLTALACAVVMTLHLLDSRVGRSIRSLKKGAIAAETAGVNTLHARLVAFVYAAVLAGLAGWLYAHFQRTINPASFGIGASIQYLFMVVIGGVGSIAGAITGAAFVTLAMDMLQSYLPRLLDSSGNFEAAAFGLLVLWQLQGAGTGLWPLLASRLPKLSQVRPAASALAAPAGSSGMQAEPLLEVSGLSKQFGGLLAVSGVGFRVASGEITGLIGPNGAGKSTSFNLLSGVDHADDGSVRFLGQDITGHPPWYIARLGMARTFQHVRLIPDMSVLDNTVLGCYALGRASVGRALLRLDRREERVLHAQAQAQLERVGLGELGHISAGELPLGQQRILEIARALSANPRLLLLDEPAAGLRHMEKKALADLLRKLADEGVAILLVEHDMGFVMGLVDKLVVLDFGKKIAEGSPQAVQRDPRVIEAYFGGDV